MKTEIPEWIGRGSGLASRATELWPWFDHVTYLSLRDGNNDPGSTNLKGSLQDKMHEGSLL